MTFSTGMTCKIGQIAPDSSLPCRRGRSFPGIGYLRLRDEAPAVAG